MLLLSIAAVAGLIFWLASKEKPLYRKAYFRTRADGVFKSDYAPGFEEYLDHVRDETTARFTVGPFAPTDDLHADLYHPEIEENWRRELSGLGFARRLRDVLNVAFTAIICASVAAVVAAILTHRYGVLANLFSDPDDPNLMAKLVGWALGIAVPLYVFRSRNANSRTQGYLDGYSDRCVGPDRPLRIIAPPTPQK